MGGFGVKYGFGAKAFVRSKGLGFGASLFAG